MFSATLLKNALFALLLLLLCFPFIQQCSGLISEPPLRGAFHVQPKPSVDSISLRSWMNGSFQEEFNNRLEKHIGFHNTLVRLNNQLQYLLFHKANAQGVVVGKSRELYEEDYISAAKGVFYLGQNHWRRKALQLRRLQDTLLQQNKLLLIVFEPGKGSVYPHHFPTSFDRLPSVTSNYAEFSKALAAQGVKTLDLNQCFIAWNDTVSYRLFPRTGTHWSYYGAALAADTTLRYLRSFFGDRIPEMRIEALKTATEVRHPDDDIWLAMNLLLPVPYENLAYPILGFSQAQAPGVKALIVGDSFYFNWQNDAIMKNAFAGGAFWYYNKHVWNHEWQETGLVSELDFLSTVMSHDVIMIMITERFHQNFAWRFDEQLYAAFFGDGRTDEERMLDELLVDNEHFLRMVKDADKRSISVHERLMMEVEYLLWDRTTKNSNSLLSREDLIIRLMDDIKNTADWYTEVKKKAAEKGISVEQMLRLDAEWMVDNPQ